MPSTNIYLPEDVYAKLRTAARTFRLTNKQLMRAILCAAVGELERADGRVLPGDEADQPAPPSAPPSAPPHQRAQEGSGAS